MDIRKELIDLASAKRNADQIVDDLENQREEARKKIHIINVVDAISKIENILNSDPSLFQHFSAINILGQDDTDMGLCLFVRASLKDHPEILVPIPSQIKDIFDDINGFYYYYVNDNFKDGSTVSFEINEDLSDNLFDLLLSKELKAVLDYNRLDLNLNPKEENTSRKIKI